MAVTKTELKSSFLKDIQESAEHSSAIQYYTELLTGQAKSLSSSYQTAAQSAAQQASYDISGAYANYLKQQRNITSQGQLESGYKEELSTALQSQYELAYQQARTTEAGNLAKIQTDYSKALSTYEEQAQKAYDQIYKSAEKEAQLQANLYKFAEEQLTDTEGIYTTGEKPGEIKITPYGVEQFRKYLLQDDAFKQRLEEEGLTEELEYYLGDPQGLHKKLFGFEETRYEASSPESVSANLSAPEKQSKEWQTKQLESAINAVGGTMFSKNTDFNAYFDIYRTQYGLTDDEIKNSLLSESQRDNMSLEDAIMLDMNLRAKSGENMSNPVLYYHDIFVDLARKKYSTSNK